MSNDTALIIGARSDIGLAVAHAYAAQGYDIQLAARNTDTLEISRKDISLRYNVAVTLRELDVLAVESFVPFIDALPTLPQVAVCAVGLIGDQEESQNEAPAATLVMRSNFEGPATFLGVLANRFEARGNGTIVGISSVAGERGRAKNYIYGSAKAGFTAFLSGLRNRLAKRGVHVVTVLPGFVATRMTEGMDLPARLTAQPDDVANAIVHAVKSRRNVSYVKPVWQIIMFVIKSIPERIFKRMSI